MNVTGAPLSAACVASVTPPTHPGEDGVGGALIQLGFALLLILMPMARALRARFGMPRRADRRRGDRLSGGGDVRPAPTNDFFESGTTRNQFPGGHLKSITL